ncbi:MAG: ECF-type sigma factor [Phycisphaerae bacterium]
MRVVTSVGELLANFKPGDEGSMEALLPLVYAELRTVAGSYLSGDAAHTLQPTALVHEAFIKMVGSDRTWSGRDHFMAVAATAMRQVLVDHARKKGAAKRGGTDGRRAARADISIEGLTDGARNAAREMRIIELDDLLTELARSDPRAARNAEMRLFGGMDQEQIARMQGISRTVVTTDWQFARAWLASRYKDDGGTAEAARG